MPVLCHESEIPLYQQLCSRLETIIQEGGFERNRLPSENRLCKEYEVSRITVRQAVSLLERKNLVYSIQGKGTFIKEPLLNQHLLRIVKFGNLLKEKGIQGYSQAVHFAEAPNAINESKDFLKPEENGNLYRLDIIGYAQDTPIVYYNSYLRADVAAEIHKASLINQCKKKAFSTFDLYDVIGVKLGHVDQRIKAVNADKQLAQALKIPKGRALIMLESFVSDDKSRPVEYKRGYYHNDKFAFHIKREL